MSGPFPQTRRPTKQDFIKAYSEVPSEDWAQMLAEDPSIADVIRPVLTSHAALVGALRACEAVLSISPPLSRSDEKECVTVLEQARAALALADGVAR